MARKDLRALRAMLDEETFAEEIFGFHAQQAAEKAMKAWLIRAGGGHPPRIHDLSRLLSLLEENSVGVDEHLALIELNPYAVQFRYEEGGLAGAPLDRGRAIRRIEALLATVEEARGESSDDPGDVSGGEKPA